MTAAAVRERVVNGRHVYVRYDKYGRVMALASDRAGVSIDALRAAGIPVAHTCRHTYKWYRPGVRDKITGPRDQSITHGQRDHRPGRR